MHLIFNDYGSCFVSVRIKKKCCQEHSSLRKQKQEKKLKQKKRFSQNIYPSVVYDQQGVPDN